MAQPPTEPAEVLADIWCSALGLDRVEADDNFFGLGGESLAAASIVTHIGQRPSIDIPLREFYRDGTFGNCLARVRRALADQPAAPAEPQREPGPMEDAESPRPADGRCSIAQEWLLDMSEQPSQEGIADFLVQQAITLRGRTPHQSEEGPNGARGRPAAAGRSGPARPGAGGRRGNGPTA